MTDDEALRVVGHLLEHHPTTTAEARDRDGARTDSCAESACYWCLAGAIDVVCTRAAGRMRMLNSDVFMRAFMLLFPGHEDGGQSCRRLVQAWDLGGPEWRAQAVERLKTAGLEP